MLDAVWRSPLLTVALASGLLVGSLLGLPWPVDPGLMELVVSNLLENAARYSPDGSPIDVTLRGEGRKVVLDVADRGKGIPAQHRERIFEKFFRLDDGGAGTGLGLSICRAVTEAHGGTVEVFPRDGGGTVFRVALPAYGEAET